MIFVSIASYRDPELTPTIVDCLAKATDPGKLHIGVCWQHADDEDLSGLPRDARISVIDVDFRESQGVCWARAQAMSLYDGEDYYLQLDSHHRFASGWDQRLNAYLEKCSSEKPILTAYPPAYEPGVPLEMDPACRPEFDRFTPDGIALLKPVLFEESLVRGRFLAAGFLFTLGSFAQEVPYDPLLYFHGEEITLALRSFTWGYDFFHPAEPIVWHQYERVTQKHHWDDHVADWRERDQLSKQRARQVLLGELSGRFGHGPIRTVAEYEEYAGIKFA